MRGQTQAGGLERRLAPGPHESGFGAPERWWRPLRRRLRGPKWRWPGRAPLAAPV